MKINIEKTLLIIFFHLSILNVQNTVSLNNLKYQKRLHYQVTSCSDVMAGIILTKTKTECVVQCAQKFKCISGSYTKIDQSYFECCLTDKPFDMDTSIIGNTSAVYFQLGPDNFGKKFWICCISIYFFIASFELIGYKTYTTRTLNENLQLF